MSLEQIQSFPAAIRFIYSCIAQINRFFDWLYHSRYNPLYRSGTLIVGLFAILLITGLYLILFYQVGAPYESMQSIEHDIWLGSWVRAVHRYATDAALLAVIFHIFQLLAQGRTWGPRFLAWSSGVVLLAGMLFSAWSGYVMVWDKQGQLLAMAGAEMMQVFPFLKSTIAQAFDGTTELRGSFFFMNLFLHVAIPLGMVAGIWVHTARLNRTAWFPKKEVFVGSCIAIGTISAIIPAALGEKANLLELVGRVPVDWFYGFWLPIYELFSPLSALTLWIVIFLLACMMPWVVKPRDKELFAPSRVDIDACSGCKQCSRDCPYEAITMRERTGPIPLYSHVDEFLCVSCGICSASCDDYAIGPPDRTANEQKALFENAAFSESKTNNIAALICKSNGDALTRLDKVKSEHDIDVLPIECCGTLHAENLQILLDNKSGVLIWGCPERNCKNRDGEPLLKQRIFEFRHPTLKRRVDRRRIKLLPIASWEERELLTELSEFKLTLDSLDKQIEPEPERRSRRYFPVVRGSLASAFLVCVIALISNAPMGTEPEHGVIRTALHLPGIARQQCRELTENEKSALPRHMQKQQICENKSVAYRLNLFVDGKRVVNKVVERTGLKGDRPIAIEESVPLSVGSHNISVDLTPLDPELSSQMSLKLSRNLSFSKGEIKVVTYQKDQNSLLVVDRSAQSK